MTLISFNFKSYYEINLIIKQINWLIDQIIK